MSVICFVDAVRFSPNTKMRQIIDEIDRRFLLSKCRCLYKLRQPYKTAADLGRGDWRLMRKEVRW